MNPDDIAALLGRLRDMPTAGTVGLETTPVVEADLDALGFRVHGGQVGLPEAVEFIDPGRGHSRALGRSTGLANTAACIPRYRLH